MTGLARGSDPLFPMPLSASSRSGSSTGSAGAQYGDARLSRWYVLPQDIEIRPLTDTEARALYPVDTEALGAGRMLLRDRGHDSHRFVVNAVIARYLELFREPTTPRFAAERLAAEARCDVDAIIATTSAFFTRMRDLAVLRRAAPEAQCNHEPLTIDVGAPLGRYRVTECLVAKMDVTICRAEDPEGGRVVLKILTAPHRHSSELREDFRREFALMRSVAPHPALCRCIAFEEGECMYAVLEDIDGRPLRRQFARATFSLGERLQVCRESVNALAHLHAHGFLHGDVHARNFLRDANGRVRLIDLGLACTIEEGGPDGDVVHGGVPLFMPPERISERTLSVSQQPGDLRSEVYQLAAVCYEVLSGAAPFSALRTWNQLARAIREIMPPPLAITPEGETIPPAVSRVMERAMAKAPRARFASAVAFSQVLADAISPAPRRSAAPP